MAFMMTCLKDTPSDIPFTDAMVAAGLAERFGGKLQRNKFTGAKAKRHPDAIDFQLGEQTDGAANELRGCVHRNGVDEDVWKPPANLKIDKEWRISDTRVFELIDLATQSKGPLAESASRKRKTSSTGNGRVATFIVDYFAALVTAYDTQFPNGSSSATGVSASQ